MKNQLLEDLQEFRSFMVYKNVPLTGINRLGIAQVAIYDNVKLHWNGSVLKFWYGDEDCSDGRMFLDSDIERYWFDVTEQGMDRMTVMIKNCPEVVEILCSRS